MAVETSVVERYGPFVQAMMTRKKATSAGVLVHGYRSQKDCQNVKVEKNISRLSSAQ
jgi:hypothetical protein